MPTPHKPELVVLTGPMFSGKSAELIRQVVLARIAGLNVLAVKPLRDTATSGIESRNGCELHAIVVPNAEAIFDHLEDSHVWVAIDEAHFFDMTLYDAVVRLVRSGRRVIVAGLDLNFAEAPFEVISKLMSFAQEVRKMHSVCGKCGSFDGSRSLRLTDNKESLVAGDRDNYDGRCIECFVPPVL